MTKITNLALLALLLGTALPVQAEDAQPAAKPEKKSAVKTIEADVKKGASATVKGVEKVGKGIGTGVKKGAEGLVKGTEAVIKGTGKGIEKVGEGAKKGVEKLTGKGKKADKVEVNNGAAPAEGAKN